MSVPRSQIAAAMQQLIQVREDLMVDEGVATRPGNPGDTPDLNPETGQPTTPAGATIYSGPCTISDPSSALQGNRTVADQSGVPNTRILKLPNDSPDLAPGDRFVVTVSLLSPSLVGDVFTVIGEEERSYATYRRYVIRGSSWLSPPA